MKPKKLSLLLTILPMIIAATGCHSRQESKADITPHCINLQADSLYQQAIALMESSYDVDSTRKCIRFLDKALAIDSLNPDYYGMKAKLLSEMGELDSALYIQTLAMEKNAITGEYLFQLGLLQAAHSLYENKDSLFMRNIDEIRKRFPERLLEIEMTRRVKPHSLVNQIRRIQIEKDYNIDFDMDSLVEATVNKD